jgi:hemoglobin/transferrin/lactoferrin receptor protein
LQTVQPASNICTQNHITVSPAANREACFPREKSRVRWHAACGIQSRKLLHHQLFLPHERIIFVKNPWPCLSALACSYFLTTACAEEKPLVAPPTPATIPARAEVIEEAEVTVTATRTLLETFRAPYTVDVVSQSDIAQGKGAASLADALDDLPGVMIQKTSPGQGSPFIRGFTGYQTLLLIDGVRFNNSTLRSGPNQYWRTVDPLSLEQIEVVKGPFSTLYGSDAVGGVVNAITKNPEWGDGKHLWQGLDWGGRSYYRAASGERSNIGHLELEAAFKDKVAFLFTGSYKDFDDLRTGGGVAENTGFSEFGADGKIVWRIDKQQELTFAAQHYRQQAVPRTEQTVYSESFHGTATGTEFRRDSDQFRSLSYAQYHAKDLNPIVDDLVVNINYQNQQEERDRKTSNGRTDVSGFDVDTFGGFVHLQSKTPIGRLSYGFDFYHDNADSFKHNFNADGAPRSNDIQGPLGDNSRYDLFGAFLQNDVWLFNDRLNLIAGARYSYASADAAQVQNPADNSKFSINDHWGSVVGNLRALVFLDSEKHWNVFTGASQAFRAPSLSDLTSFDATSAVETPTPGLKPERYIQFEAGVKGRYEHFCMTLSYFHTLIEDQITQSPTGALINKTPEVVKTNSGNGWNQGVEARVEYTFFKAWTPWADGTWQEGEVDQLNFASGAKVRASITRAMPATAHLGLRYHPAGKKWSVEVFGTFTGREDDLSLRDKTDTRRIPAGGTPGYMLLNIRGSAEIARNLSISGGVENITDENYRVHGSGANSTGINAYLSLDWKF